MQNKWIETTEKTKQKKDFYRALGYSERASTVLSMVSYGNQKLSFILSHIDAKNKLTILHDWLFSLETIPPEKAIDSFYDLHHQPHGIERMHHMATRMIEENYSGFAEFDACIMEDVGSLHNAPSETDGVASIALSSTDSYNPIEEKPARSVFASPTSTFRMTTNTASMGMVMNQIYNGRKVTMDQVRIEEVLNYFDYDAVPPTDAMFAISTELLPKKNGKKILYINVQAKAEQKEHQNVVLLLDVSGSMRGNNVVTQEAIAAVLSKLRPGDKFSLVTYSDVDHTVLDGYLIENNQDKEIIMSTVLGLIIGGCTYGSAGIETAYALGAKHYQPDWSNQVILITDGDLNFGISSNKGLEALIEGKKKSNLFLSVIGTGLYNYKDDKLEVLSKHGNGTYCVVNELPDVEESIVRRYISLTNIIAKDVKAQVEFNPRRVKTYRLLGYENRELTHDQFKDDAVISEPYGSGGHGVALYELELADGEEMQSELKYQTPKLTNSDEIATIKLRYKEPLSDHSEVIEAVVTGNEDVSANAHLAYLLYCASETLRGSDKLDECDRAYLETMLTGKLYKVFSGANEEKMDRFMSPLTHEKET